MHTFLVFILLSRVVFMKKSNILHRLERTFSNISYCNTVRIIMYREVFLLSLISYSLRLLAVVEISLGCLFHFLLRYLPRFGFLMSCCFFFGLIFFIRIQVLNRQTWMRGPYVIYFSIKSIYNINIIYTRNERV